MFLSSWYRTLAVKSDLKLTALNATVSIIVIPDLVPAQMGPFFVINKSLIKLSDISLLLSTLCEVLNRTISSDNTSILRIPFSVAAHRY